MSASLLAMLTVAQALMPQPRTHTVLPGSLRLDGAVVITGHRDALIESGFDRFAARVRAKTGVLPKRAATGSLQIHCVGPGDSEAYKLTVREGGAQLRAQSPVGVLRGLATLYQLASRDAALAYTEIDDAPRFAWRGLMIDVSRHFMPREAIERQIDGMEIVKLNVLHLHLSDAQGFRVESKIWPKLASEERYSQDDIRAIVEYARLRGVRVVPEFDVPGHTKSWFDGYPELAAAKNSTITHATLDVTREEVYTFLDRLFGEMAALFPGPYFHIGGDEVTGRDWAANPAIQRVMRERGFADQHALQAWFTGRVRQILVRHGKKMIGWDEVLRPDLERSVVVESWRSSKMSARAAVAGHPVIVAGPYYLDFTMPAGYHYAMDPLDSAAFGLTPAERALAKGTAIEPYMGEEREVTGPTPWTKADQARVLGAEAALWTEIVTPAMLDARLWPGMAAIAERFWSPAAVRDTDDMYRRLEVVDRDLESAGLKHHANGPPPSQAGLAGLLDPVRFYGRIVKRNRPGHPPAGAMLADHLPSENLAVRRFERDVRAHDWPAVRAALEAWRAAASAFTAPPEYLALARDAESLARGGLQALDQIEHAKPAPAGAIEAAKALARKHQQLAAAASGIVSSILKPQPPEEMTIAIAPAIGELLTLVR